MTSKVLSFTIIFVTILYIGIQGLYAQPPVKYIVYSVSVNVMQFKGGTKALVKKGQVIDDKTILDIPAGGSVQIIDKKNKIVLESSPDFSDNAKAIYDYANLYLMYYKNILGNIGIIMVHVD